MANPEITFLQTDASLSTLEGSTSVFFERFFDTPDAVSLIQNVCRRSPLWRDWGSFVSHLAGRIFEDVSYEYLKDQYNHNGTTVLSGKETLQLFRDLNPEKKLINHYDLHFGISGITVPDNLILGVEREVLVVRGIVECKSGPLIHKPHQLRHYLSSDYVMQDFGASARDHNFSLGSAFVGPVLHKIREDIPSLKIEVAPDLQIIYITPEDSPLNQEGIRRIRLPFSSSYFKEFVSSFLADCNPNFAPRILASNF